MKWQEVGETPCSMARSLAILGDRWTLLILRNCFLGMRRFDEFQASLGVTRQVLADRLSRLVEAGALKKVPYQERPPRYEYRLTEMGLTCIRCCWPWPTGATAGSTRAAALRWSTCTRPVATSSGRPWSARSAASRWGRAM